MRIPQGLIEQNRLALIRQFLISRSLLRSKTRSELALAPITTLPTRMPCDVFEAACASTPLFHRLLDEMTTDVAALLAMYVSIRASDEFVDSFCRIVENVYVKGSKDLKQSIRAYVTRNDFLAHQEPADAAPDSAARQEITIQLKQVEVNLSSVVGPHTMQELSELHRMLVIPEFRCKLPENKPRDRLVDNMRAIDDLYRIKLGDGRRQCILWVTGQFESNLPEILMCVAELRCRLGGAEDNDGSMIRMSPGGAGGSGPSVESRNSACAREEARSYRSSGSAVSGDTGCTRVFIVTWDDLVNRISSLKFESERMYFNPADFIYNEESFPYEVSIVYFRTGYAPQHYQTQTHWQLRELMEAAECIVIPSAVSQLAGLKKAQQVWSMPQYRSAFVEPLRRFFMPQADLNEADPATLALIEDAKAHPENYVLKPQREGGGNNVYGADIPPALAEVATRRGQHNEILMAKIRSPETLTETFANDTLAVLSCVSEIGFYGVACFSGSHEVINEPIGYLLRTKDAQSNEGGISVQAAVFDSVMLV